MKHSLFESLACLDIELQLDLFHSNTAQIISSLKNFRGNSNDKELLKYLKTVESNQSNI